ncbi:alpha/beta hydrolase [Pseudochryseolinea flava]|uniref:Phospholipase n=1 Tax=Pseudochryseolinea flava TaxID=2059302 RepID=A0A364XZS3_9BACT|nr:dienelactone hydrolase family protein [Pseudochryseolinea flava]RAV99283.1 phospholipase [Pseudochryseolinea flava]
MHKKNIVTAGKDISTASKALIMLHGRGATAEDILSLANHLHVSDYALIAPQATNYTWYPYSFLAPVQQNEPWLSYALALIEDIVADVNKAGIPSDKIYFAGFSQGACLTLEFVTRNAQRWGGAAAFTGGLIGESINHANYKGDFKNTPIFIGTSDPDPHVPVARVNASEAVIKNLKADVTVKVYKNLGHTIAKEEIDLANKIVWGGDVNR